MKTHTMPDAPSDPLAANTPEARACTVVLDTQAVLDWLHFEDPSTSPWQDWLTAGHWRWMMSNAMRNELAHVLEHGRLPTSRHLSATDLLRLVDQCATMVADLPVATSIAGLRCKDRDDQKFIDFAHQHRVNWLVSRDKAVLKVGRRLLSLSGTRIVTPGNWRPDLTYPVLAHH